MRNALNKAVVIAATLVSIVFVYMTCSSSPRAEATTSLFSPTNLYVGSVSQAVFMIQPVTFEGVGMGAGSGFLVSTPDGKIVVLTNRHVCEEDGIGIAPVVFLFQQGALPEKTRVLKVSEVSDLCAIEVPERFKENTPIPIAEYGPIFGEPLITLGHPGLRPLSYGIGIYVGNVKDSLGAGTMFPDDFESIVGLTTIETAPGASGSPILNRRGEVVGVLFALTMTERHALFINLLDIKRFLSGGF